MLIRKFTPLLAALAMLPVGALSQQSPVDEICARYCGFDHDNDGAVELASVRALHSAGSGPRMLVLLEARLASNPDQHLDLVPKVHRLVEDLGREGYAGVAVEIELGESEKHQDGRYVLALRELLRAFAAGGELAGVLLVGHFPDAFLVRTCNWRKRGAVVLRAKQPDQKKYDAPYLRRVPEAVAHRADIVLSDLDGHWEDVYVQPRTRLPSTVAVFDGTIPERGGLAVDLDRSSVVFEDFFHVRDGTLDVRQVRGPDGGVAGRAVVLQDRSGDHECSERDRLSSNILSSPDIAVSRIDARGTAMCVREDIVGATGEHLLNADGKPQPLTFSSSKQVPDWRHLWRLDAQLERQLLGDYLDRNHAYRTGEAAVAWRPSSIAHGLGSGFAEISKAADNWLPPDGRLSDVGRHATLATVARWLAFPAVLRTLRAHSDAWGSVFARPSMEELAAQLGGPAWSWSRDGEQLVPSLQSACGGGKFDWHLLHTLWRNGSIASEPCFYHHTGCHGISPPNAARRAYDHPAYGVRQGAEALLFFGNGLALIGRAKVFYDEPRGFAQELRMGSTFGAAWARYYEIESRAERWSQVGGDIGRKRSYFWSVLGDCSLRLHREQPRRR